MEVAGEKGEGKVFKDVNEAQMAYDLHDITLHTRIAFKADYINQLYPNSIPAEHLQDYLITTFGKIIFNRIPSRSSLESFPYLNDPEGKDVFVKTADKYFCPMGTNIPEFIKKLDETRAHERQEKARKSAIDQIVKEKEVKASSVTEDEINEVVSYDALAISGVTKPFNKGFLKQIVAETFKRFKSTETSKMLDRLKDTGFKYCTKSGITVCAFDITLFEKKREIVAEAQKEADDIVKEAEARIIAMIDEHEITKKAYEEKDKLISAANDKSRQITQGAREYADNILGSLSKQLEQTLRQIEEDRKELN
jgi:DNA-directed RNA polymerase subunit beta'